jgi:hypothetical protein
MSIKSKIHPLDFVERKLFFIRGFGVVTFPIFVFTFYFVLSIPAFSTAYHNSNHHGA